MAPIVGNNTVGGIEGGLFVFEKQVCSLVPFFSFKMIE